MTHVLRRSATTVLTLIRNTAVASTIIALGFGTNLAIATDVLISEFQANPVAISDADGEWVELHNQSASDIDLDGWTLNDGDSDLVFDSSDYPTVISADSFFVICLNNSLADANCDYEWSGLDLTNAGDSITLTNPLSTVVDEFTYGSSDVTEGASTEVATTGESTKVFFSNTEDEYEPNGNTGTPGATNRFVLPVTNQDTGEGFTNIQAAIDDSDTLDGHTILIANGTYDENPNISKSLVFNGESENGVVIVADNGGYGLENTVDDLDLEFSNFTLKDSVHYGFKLTGSDAVLTNITVENSARTEFDFNGMTNVELNDVTAQGQNTSGNGVSFTNSHNIVVDGLTTSDNNWGGVALYPYGVDYPIGINSATIENLNASEPNELYVQVGPGGSSVGSLTAPQYKYIVTNDEFRAEAEEFSFYQRTLSDATSYAIGLHAQNGGNTDSAITRISDQWRLVPASEGLTIKAAVEDTPANGTVRLLNGEHTDDLEQIVIDLNLNLYGGGMDQTIVKAQFDTGSGGDSRGWFLVNPGAELDMRKLTLDGSDHKVYQAIRQRGSGYMTQIAFENIIYPTYHGTAVAAFGDGAIDITSSTFDNIGRIGVLYFEPGVNGSRFANNTYTGKGAGDWLDYALDISAGADVTVTNNTITNNYGVASSDGSVSAGALVTTFFGGGTKADFRNNTFSDNSNGIAVGYDGSDSSTALGRGNTFSDNDMAVYSTTQLVDFRGNFWGDNSGPTDDNPSDGSIPATNPGGSGDEVGSNVWYANWTIVDESGPEVTYTAPSNGDIVGNTNISFEITDETNISQYSFNISGPKNWSTKKWTPNTKSVSITDLNLCDSARLNDCNESSLPSGEYKVRVAAYDGIGNRNISSSVTFILDNDGPTVNITNPEPNELVSDVLLDATIADQKLSFFNIELSKLGDPDWKFTTQKQFAETGQTDYTLSEFDVVDAAYYGTCDGQPCTTWGGNRSDLPDGEYKIRINAYDEFGNRTIASHNFTLDATAPLATIEQPADNQVVSGQTMLIGRVNDAHPMNSYFRIEGPDNYLETSLFQDGRTTHEYMWESEGLVDGEYTIYFEARDQANNKNGSRTNPGDSVVAISVTVDNTTDTSLNGDGEEEEEGGNVQGVSTTNSNSNNNQVSTNEQSQSPALLAQNNNPRTQNSNGSVLAEEKQADNTEATDSSANDSEPETTSSNSDETDSFDFNWWWVLVLLLLGYLGYRTFNKPGPRE